MAKTITLLTISECIELAKAEAQHEMLLEYKQAENSNMPFLSSDTIPKDGDNYALDITVMSQVMYAMTYSKQPTYYETPQDCNNLYAINAAMLLMGLYANEVVLAESAVKDRVANVQTTTVAMKLALKRIYRASYKRRITVLKYALNIAAIKETLYAQDSTNELLCTGITVSKLNSAPFGLDDKLKTYGITVSSMLVEIQRLLRQMEKI